MKEQEIINIAIENLEKVLQTKIEWLIGKLDGQISIKLGKVLLNFKVEVKKEVHNHQLPAIIRNKDNNPNLMIIAEKIYPGAKEQFHESNIPYIETNGNIYFRYKDVLIWIEKSNPTKIPRETGNRAFTKTGLKVLFHFLLDKNLVNMPQRQIADLTGVGLGNIPQVIAGLKETGFLQQKDKKTYLWINRRGLLDRWITEYGMNLKKSLLMGTYKLKGNWRDLNLNENTSAWGGEPAGDILTNYLRPGELTLYTAESKLELMKKLKLIPDKNGELKVYNMFWKKQDNEHIVPPILVYADLMLENNKRCTETAQIIFDEQIKPNL